MKPTRDELEFLISQYIDGSLNPLDQGRVEEMLASDVDAREVLSEYQQLDGLVKNSLPVPEMDWDGFARSISTETAKLDAPVKHYRLNLNTWSKVVALAAMVAIAFGIVMKLRPRDGSTEIGSTGTKLAVNLQPVDVQISGPPIMTAQAVNEISIGTPPGLASIDYHSAEAIISRPTSIWIASGTQSGQDTDPSIY